MKVRLDVVILSLYLTMNLVISSLIVGTCKSVCKILLDLHNGAFTIVRRFFLDISVIFHCLNY
jgi:hypothetical protein